MNKTKQNKYKYYYVLQGNYGYGWDDLVFYEKKCSTTDFEAFKEARQDKKSYIENEKGIYRIIERKEKNEN